MVANIHLHNTFRWSALIFVMLLLLFASCGIALAEGSLANKDSIFHEGRLWKTDGCKLHFSEIRSGEVIMIHMPEMLGEEQLIGNEQVLKVEEEKRSYAVEYGDALGAAGLVGSAIGVSISNTNGIEPSNSTKNAIILGMNAISGLIGTTIGAEQIKYETVYNSPEIQQRSNIRILPELNFSTKTVKVRMSYRF